MDLAKELNDALFRVGNDPYCECVRIAFKGPKSIGSIERDLGGMNKKSMELWLREELDRLLWDRKPRT